LKLLRAFDLVPIASLGADKTSAAAATVSFVTYFRLRSSFRFYNGSLCSGRSIRSIDIMATTNKAAPSLKLGVDAGM